MSPSKHPLERSLESLKLAQQSFDDSLNLTAGQQAQATTLLQQSQEQLSCTLTRGMEWASSDSHKQRQAQLHKYQKTLSLIPIQQLLPVSETELLTERLHALIDYEQLLQQIHQTLFRCIAAAELSDTEKSRLFTLVPTIKYQRKQRLQELAHTNKKLYHALGFKGRLALGLSLLCVTLLGCVYYFLMPYSMQLNVLALPEVANQDSTSSAWLMQQKNLGHSSVEADGTRSTQTIPIPDFHDMKQLWILFDLRAERTLEIVQIELLDAQQNILKNYSFDDPAREYWKLYGMRHKGSYVINENRLNKYAHLSQNSQELQQRSERFDFPDLNTLHLPAELRTRLAQERLPIHFESRDALEKHLKASGVSLDWRQKKWVRNLFKTPHYFAKQGSSRQAFVLSGYQGDPPEYVRITLNIHYSSVLFPKN